MIKKSIAYVLLSIILCFLSGCALLEPVKPPYVVSKPICKIGELVANYTCGGIEFTFYNTSDKTISSIEISCMIYDATTKKNPFIGSNIIRSSFNGVITSHNSKKLVLSLDPYMYTIPDEPYLIDFFYIAKITYSDASSWEDPYGVYTTRSY